LKLTEIFKRLFSRRSNTVVLDKDMLMHNKPINQPDVPDDKSIFEIAHIVNIKEHETIISGKIKRGVFRTGDRIALYNPTGSILKAEAVIINIKTSLVEVNRITGGFNADFLIETPEGCPEIETGDRVYKIQEELKNVIQ